MCVGVCFWVCGLMVVPSLNLTPYGILGVLLNMVIFYILILGMVFLLSFLLWCMFYIIYYLCVLIGIFYTR